MAAGCGPPADDPSHRTQAEKDSALANSTVLPGAAGVRGAQRADSIARARNAQRDSLAAQP